MKLSTRIVTAALLIAGSSGVVYALGKHADWGMTPAEKVEFVSDRVSKKLELDGSQRDSFEKLAESVAGVMQQVRPSPEQRRDEILQLLQEPTLDQAKLLEMVQQRTRAIDEKAPEVVARLAVFLDSLNAEQRQKLQEFVKHRHHAGHRHLH